MKKTISYLLLAHVIATTFAVISHASMYTMLYLYLCQASILLVVLTISELRGRTSIYKFFSIIQMLMFSSFIAILFFILGKLEGSVLVYVNDLPRYVDLGKLHILPLVFGSTAFLINYLLDIKYKRKPKPKKDLTVNMLSFFVIFCNVAALILILVSAVMFPNSTLGIIMIAIIKAVLDVGLLVLAAALTHIDGPVHSFMKRK